MITWPFGWDDIPYLALTLAIGITLMAVVARFIYDGPTWPQMLYADLRSLPRKSQVAMSVFLGIVFAFVLACIFWATSVIACGASSEIAINQPGRVSAITCEVIWIWERR